MKPNFTRAIYCLFFFSIYFAPKFGKSQSNSTFTIESTSSSNNWVSQILSLSGNRVAVIVNDGNYANTYLRIYTPTGYQAANINITSLFNWPHTNHGSVKMSAVTMDNGNIFVAYNASSNSTGIQSNNAHYTIITENGDFLNYGQLNSIDGGGTYISNVMLKKLSDGKIVAVWYKASTDNYVFRIFNADGTPSGNDVPFIGPGTLNNWSSIYGLKLAAGKSGNFMLTTYYYGGDLRGMIFNNNGVSINFDGQSSFSINETAWADYNNYGLVGLPNGNYAISYELWSNHYVEIVGPTGTTIVDNYVFNTAYNSYINYTDMIPSNAAGSQGYILTELRAQDESGMSNPYYDYYLHHFDQNGDLITSTTTSEGQQIQPTYSIAPGGAGGYIYVYSYYKAYEYNEMTGMVMPTGDQDIKGATVGFLMSTLPVSLLSYEAKLLSNQKAHLSWRTASEVNNSYFEIEKSIDGRNYAGIARVAANGTTSIASDYSFTDPEILSRNTYFRLRQVDFDGKSKDLGTRLIRTRSNNTSATAFPNPIQGSTITLTAGNETLPAPYRLTDASGRVVKTGTMKQAQEELNIHDLSDGIYFLQIGKQVIKLKK